VVDEAKAKEAILHELKVGRKVDIGEQAGGSDHLAYISIMRFDLEPAMQVLIGKAKAWKISFTIETYTETEFLHDPSEDVYYTHKYNGIIVLDADYNVLDFKT